MFIICHFDQVLSNDPKQKLAWESAIFEGINQLFPSEKYILLSSIQLVGLLLVVIVAKEKIGFIRKVECLSKKVSYKLLHFMMAYFSSYIIYIKYRLDLVVSQEIKAP